MKIQVFYKDVDVVFHDCFIDFDGEDFWFDYDNLNIDISDDIHDEIIGLLEDNDVCGMISFMLDRSENGNGWFEESYKNFWILRSSSVMIELD